MTEEIKKKTIISSISLFFQSGYSAILGFLANLVLTLVVSPKTYGIYIAVLSFIAILNYFSDLGLSAALIQKKKITQEDLKTTFTTQQVLILSLLTLGFFFTPWIIKFYHLPPHAKYLYWSLLIGFFLSSLKTIPSIILEKKIEFQKIVFVQMVENTIFYLAVIIFALFNFDLISFALAVLIRSLTGLILIYKLSFWPIKIGFNHHSFKKLFSFGLLFQINSLLALVKDEFTILFLGKVLGFEKLGYLGFAKKWAEAPIRIVMDNISRVLFPLMSQYQSDSQKLKKIIEKSLFFQSLILIPSVLGIILVLPYLMELIPKYNKWLPTIPLLYLFAISSITSSFSTPFINLFNSLGKVKITLKLMIFWSVGTWFLTPLLTLIFDVYGFPLTLIILSLTFFYIVLLAQRFVTFSFLKPTLPSLTSSLVMILLLGIINRFVTSSLNGLIINILMGIISYILILILFFGINPFKIKKII